MLKISLDTLSLLNKIIQYIQQRIPREFDFIKWSKFGPNNAELFKVRPISRRPENVEKTKHIVNRRLQSKASSHSTIRKLFGLNFDRTLIFDPLLFDGIVAVTHTHLGLARVNLELIPRVVYLSHLKRCFSPADASRTHRVLLQMRRHDRLLGWRALSLLLAKVVHADRGLAGKVGDELAGVHERVAQVLGQ